MQFTGGQTHNEMMQDGIAPNAGKAAVAKRQLLGIGLQKLDTDIVDRCAPPRLGQVAM